jgi:hypothetical protein
VYSRASGAVAINARLNEGDDQVDRLRTDAYDCASEALLLGKVCEAVEGVYDE